VCKSNCERQSLTRVSSLGQVLWDIGARRPHERIGRGDLGGGSDGCSKWANCPPARSCGTHIPRGSARRNWEVEHLNGPADDLACSADIGIHVSDGTGGRQGIVVLSIPSVAARLIFRDEPRAVGHGYCAARRLRRVNSVGVGDAGRPTAGDGCGTANHALVSVTKGRNRRRVAGPRLIGRIREGRAVRLTDYGAVTQRLYIASARVFVACMTNGQRQFMGSILYDPFLPLPLAGTVQGSKVGLGP
jgi:hypothetical protein